MNNEITKAVDWLDSSDEHLSVVADPDCRLHGKLWTN
jgi:hypothetical protein